MPPITPPAAPSVEPVRSPEALEAALGLGLADWRHVKQGLKALGFDPGSPDGIPESRTRKALAAWQQKQGEKATGYLTASQRDGILGSPAAQIAIGFMYRDGKVVGKDEAAAARWFGKAADQGNADAQFILGEMYAAGRVVKSEPEAVRLFRKAADQSHAAAQYNLGVMYASGRGVTLDSVVAGRWYRRAAEQGNADAQYNLGQYYEFGYGVKKDEAEAARWYRKAADQGDARAQAALRLMTPPAVAPPALATPSPAELEATLGLGRKDWRELQQGLKALGFDPGERTGIPGAATRSAVAAWQTRVGEPATQHLKAGQRDRILGFAAVQTSIGLMYNHGDGVAKDYTEAVRWFRKAAAQGYADAQYNLGVMSDNGRGMTKDEAEAVRWYRRAANQGHAQAQAALQPTTPPAVAPPALVATSPPELEAALGLSRMDWRNIQQGLKSLGFDPAVSTARRDRRPVRRWRLGKRGRERRRLAISWRATRRDPERRSRTILSRLDVRRHKTRAKGLWRSSPLVPQGRLPGRCQRAGQSRLDVLDGRDVKKDEAEAIR